MPGDPFTVAAFYGTPTDDFQPNQTVILYSNETRLACLRHIRTVVDQGRNCCQIELE